MNTATFEDFSDHGNALTDKVTSIKNYTLKVLGRPIVEAEREENRAHSSVIHTVTIQPDPWDDILGRYDNDPTWDDFPAWLSQHRNSINGFEQS